MMFQALFRTIHPISNQNNTDSVWIGPLWEETDLTVSLIALFMGGFGLFIAIISIGDPGPLFFGLVSGGFGLFIIALLVHTMLSRPFRVDVNEHYIDLVYWNKRTIIKTQEHREVWYECLKTEYIHKGKANIRTTRQLRFVLKKRDEIIVKQGTSKKKWDILLNKLATHNQINYFVVPSEEELQFSKLAKTVHHSKFANGSDRPFSHYLEDKTLVDVSNIDDIRSWLATCKYAYDIDQFNKSDHWLLPAEFEELKKGDCEDHALWAWHKLKQLNIPAEFVVGSNTNGDDKWVGHAWIMLYINGELHVVETTAKRSRMLIPWKEAKSSYKLRLGIDHELKTYAYKAVSSAS